MATFESVENLRDDAFYNSGTLKKQKRKQKTKSLIVTTTTKCESNSANVDCLSLSASCDSSTFGLRPRFSFRKFGLGRSSSKSNLIDATIAINSNSNSTSSIDCTSHPTTPSSDPNFKCPIITYNDDGDDGDGTDDDSQLNLHIESKWRCIENMQKFRIFKRFKLEKNDCFVFMFSRSKEKRNEKHKRKIKTAIGIISSHLISSHRNSQLQLFSRHWVS